MNTPESREGNLIRYIVYTVGYLMVVGVVKLVTNNSPIRIWDLILFGLITVMVGLFYIYRFNREQRFFKRRHSLPFLGDIGLTIGLTLLVTALRIIVMYLQAYNKISWYGFQIIYLKHESIPMFWFLIVANGLVLPILQEYLATGFLFNYLFRQNTKLAAIAGIITSGIIFSILNFQLSWPLLAIDVMFGAIFAWSYLYTQALWMPMYLSILSGLLIVVMT
ncbi:CPBP family intramembrane metalloprotease [Lactobacillus amylolyticus]|uniref:CPBP family intramembrane glutamic endopeptidase n=1 Tax=Lactobacillus amylolyticus TaxID=83683 RepID=UPI0009BAD5A9|nr:type II CAAX endopeptidase family protein [Lactobacillus amylolyticus]ARD07386.1 CPBP family intramembrane metalloprotease [Lactobacillus amylolyticus]